MLFLINPISSTLPPPPPQPQLFLICSHLLNRLTNVDTISLKVIFTKATIFRCFDLCSVRPPQIFQIQAKIWTIRPVFPDYLSVSNGYGFRNKFLKNPTDQNKLIYNKQRNYHSVHWGINSPSKIPPPYFSPSPHLNLQTIQASPLFKQFPVYIDFRFAPPNLNSDFSVNLHNITFFHPQSHPVF